MILSELIDHLKNTDQVNFKLPDGSYVPQHFHITELGMVSKHFIDCGGTIRKEESISIQLWEANDFDHRLKPEKLLRIIEISEKSLPVKDVEIEIEYQNQTIGKYGLDFDGQDFLLINKHTACLASDACGVDSKGLEIQNTKTTGCCSPASGCC